MAELTREGAVKINEWFGNIESAVKRLSEYREIGRSVYINYWGHKLYSCDVTLDGAYREIMGMSKSEFDKMQEEAIRRTELAVERGEIKRVETEHLNMEGEKLKIPYYQVAKQALMNKNGLSEEQAEKIILEQSFEEIDSQVYAKGPMDYAIDGIAKYFDEKWHSPSSIYTHKDMIADFVYNGRGSEITTLISELARSDLHQSIDSSEGLHTAEYFLDNMIMDTVFAVHDGWVQDNQKKFIAREKKHQHMPSELIGWEEVKADLLFVKPIFETLGFKVNEDRLHELYNERVKEFLLNRGITTSRELSDAITQGKEFYPALANYGDDLVTISDPNYVDEHIIPAIEQNGIGKVEEIRQEIIDEFVANPNSDDISRLTKEEQEEVEQSLGQEVATLITQRDELYQKNTRIERIMDLANKRKVIKAEISAEEQRRSNILHEFDD